jgi:uncharacterized protein
MRGRRLFLDTFFVQALLNPKDAYHQAATSLLPQVEAAEEVVVTEAVLTEIGNALSGNLRSFAIEFIRRCYAEANITVVPVDTALLLRAVDFYARHGDKGWGLTDCISFVVMREREVLEAATGDRHFRQAGFRTLLSPAKS